MDPQAEAKYVGLGLMVESLTTAVGSFRALAQQQVAQLQAKDALIKELQDKLAALQPKTE